MSVPSTLAQSWLSIYSLPQFWWFSSRLYSPHNFTTSQPSWTNSSNLWADKFVRKFYSCLNSCLELSSLSDLPQLTPFHLACFPCLFVHFVVVFFINEILTVSVMFPMLQAFLHLLMSLGEHKTRTMNKVNVRVRLKRTKKWWNPESKATDKRLTWCCCCEDFIITLFRVQTKLWRDRRFHKFSVMWKSMRYSESTLCCYGWTIKTQIIQN